MISRQNEEGEFDVQSAVLMMLSSGAGSLVEFDYEDLFLRIAK